MKVAYLKREKIHIPLNGMNEIKNGKLEYFKRGEGWKKTSSYEILDIELPDRWTKMSWFQIAKICDKYGIEVANEYADCKVAGIISRQTAHGYTIIYQKIKNIIPDNFDESFFELLKCDYMLSCVGVFSLDITALDEKFAQLDSEYNPNQCTYKGKENVSLKDYVTEKYGKPYSDIIEACVKA